MLNIIKDFHPDIRDRVQGRIDSHIRFIKETDKFTLTNWVFGNPSQGVIDAMRAELSFWGIYDI